MNEKNFFYLSKLPFTTDSEVVPGFLRTLVLVRRCDGVQFASRMVSPSRDMSR
jgi:hypothetical protein